MVSRHNLNPLMPGGNKKVIHTLTNLHFQPQVCLSMVTFLLPPGTKGLRSSDSILPKLIHEDLSSLFVDG